MQTPEVDILLATYNGDRFVREQIDSILAQDYPILRILASDDGSSDRTLEILSEYADQFPSKIRLMEKQSPMGSAKANYLRLMKEATAGYICFADQDDVWLPNKVSASMRAMENLEAQHGTSQPLLVFTDLRVVDEQLKTINPSMWRQLDIDPRSVHRLNQLIGRSVVTGCTAMINRPMLELARQMPEEATMHDRWIGLLAAALGAAAIVPEQAVLYRQHDSNVVGAVTPDGSVAGIAYRAAHRDGRRAERLRSERQAEALLKLHSSIMPARNVILLRAYLRSGRSESTLERVATALQYGFSRGSLFKDLLTLFDLALSKSDEHSEG
jgi:glycosyltransferase involved in cell wall biosynthesis